MMTQTSYLEYEAPWPVYALDWCNATAPGQQVRPRSYFRIALGSYTEDYRNRIGIIGLTGDERVLADDEYGNDFEDLTLLAEAMHGFPPTCLQWQPVTAYDFAWANKSTQSELLATTGDSLRVWELTSDSEPIHSSYVGRQPSGSGYRLKQKIALTGSKNTPQNPASGAPLTSFSWNKLLPSHIVVASIDTTCTVWDINTNSAVTQLIAHDREVYDCAWLPGSTDIFVSVGADGSLRAFDLRSLEHSTILYESPMTKRVAGAPQPSTANVNGRPLTQPLLRIAFNPNDSNYMATFHVDSNDVKILDMRSPGSPVVELKGHQRQINAADWSASLESNVVATAGDDCQVLLWDMANAVAPVTSPRSAASNPRSPRPVEKKKTVTEPVLAYTGPSEVNNLAWSPTIPGMSMNTGTVTGPGEWLALACGKSIRVLRA